MIRRLLFLLLLLLTLPARAAATRPQPLNVILISADAMRGDMLGCNGHPTVKTPHLDALAAAGVNFTRAYTNITTTTPAHATQLSSLYPLDHQAYSNRARISDEIVTLPELLKQQGWHVGGIVNLPWLNPETGNVPQGFDELGRGDHVRKGDKTNRWVMRFLDGRKQDPDKPFFLWIHYIDNHTPYHSPERLTRLYYPADRDPRDPRHISMKRAWPLMPEEHRNDRLYRQWIHGITDTDYIKATYMGSVSLIDEKVGELVARIEQDGLWERTLFVFTSDHGEALGEHELFYVHAGLYEPTARIPLIVRVPGGPQGKQVSTVVDMTDIVPTILARLGMAVPAGARGEDLWAALEGRKGFTNAALLEHAGGQIEGVVTPRWKYLRHRKTRSYYPGYPIKRGTIELYDLQADPGEIHNLARKQPQIVKTMQALLKKLRGSKRGYAGADAKIDEQTEELLRSMGYTE